MSRFRTFLLVVATLTSTSAAAEGVKVALLPVVVHSQDKSDYLQAGVGDMLGSRLAQAGGLSVVRIGDPKAATTDLEAARNAARAVGARFVVFGSFTSFGDGASLDLQCARTDASDEAARQVFVQSGALASIIPKIDDLADRVARYVLDPAAAGELPAVAAGPTSRGAVSRADYDDLRRRIEVLEDANRSKATSASGLPPAPAAGGGIGAPPTGIGATPGSRTGPATR